MKPGMGKIVRVSRQYAASAEEVFDAWMALEHARRFFFATPDGKMVRMEMDARVGGSFHVIERREGVCVDYTGIYMEITRPRRLTFLLSAPFYGLSGNRVSIAVLRMAQGCEVVVSHEGVTEEAAGRTEGVWRAILEGLQRELPSAETAAPK